MTKQFESDLIEIFGKENIKKGKIKQPEKPTKQNEQNKKILEIFQKYNSEKNNELDVYQLTKYFENEWKIHLTEETIKFHCGQTFLEKSNKVQEKEFIQFHKYITQNIEEIKKETTHDIFSEFENQFLKENKIEMQSRYLDKNNFIFETNEKIHSSNYQLELNNNSIDNYHFFSDFLN